MPPASHRPLRLTFAILAAALIAGCAQAPQPPASASSVAVNAPMPAYRISRGDELNLRFFYTPELNTIATVRSDGRIGVPLIGDVVVEGLSFAELSEMLTTRLTPLVRRPDVSINLQGAGSQRVFVGGEVTKPGVQPLVGPLSLVQAVMVAEGLKETAGPQQVVVLRRGAQGERVSIAVNLAAAMNGSDASQDLILQPYDVVVVPRSGVSNLNLWIDQYIRRNLPVSLGLSYSFNRGSVYP